MSQVSPTQTIDMNQMAASVFNQAVNLQTMAEQMVGLETLWCRAVPHTNSEDIIIQEYTLSNVACPVQIKIIPEKSDYQPGNYSVDLWGVGFEQPLEVNVAYNTWNSVFGQDTAPQKGDIVYVKIYNRLYEVASSTIQYVMTSLPIAYKCTLRKYQRAASRKENEELRISIDELTTSQDILFGEHISNEVADAVIERETSYNQSTKVDPIRHCDLDCIVTEDVIGESGNLISTAYYDFLKANENTTWFGIDASYMLDNEDPNTHWIYTCWFRVNSCASDEDNHTKTISAPFSFNGIHSKSKTHYEFKFTGGQVLNPGDNVILSRGTLFNIPAVVIPEDCGPGYLLQVEVKHVLEASKKASKWWETIKSGWKISKTITPDNKKPELFTLLRSDNKVIDITTDGLSSLNIKFGNSVKKTVTLKKKLSGSWHYLCMDVHSGKADIKLINVKQSTISNKIISTEVINKEYSLGKTKGFNVSGFSLDNKGLDIQMCNIRLYESEYPMGDNYKLDMYSALTRNASKLILIDNPLPSNKMPFLSTLK